MVIFEKRRNILRPLKRMLPSVMAKKLNMALPIVVDDLCATEPPNPPTRAEAGAFIKAHPFWYHCMYLGNGTWILKTV